MPWYALYTNSRSEKKVADLLSKMGIVVYCPLVEQVRQWKDRKKKVWMPLLPSYVFVNIEETQRERVFSVKGVVQYVYWLGKPAVIREKEIAQLRLFLEQVTDPTIVFEKEKRVEIVAGILKGNSGVIEKIGKDKLSIRLDQLGFSITAEIHKSEVKQSEQKTAKRF